MRERRKEARRDVLMRIAADGATKSDRATSTETEPNTYLQSCQHGNFRM